MQSQKNDDKFCLNIPNALLCVLLSALILVSGVFPKTNTSLDQLTQPQDAHAVVPLALPVFGTVLGVLGIGVAGVTLSDYEINLESALNSFATSTGQTVESIYSQLNNAVGTDGKIMLDMLSTGFIPNLLNWSKSLDMATVDSSALSNNYVLNVPNASPLNVAFSSTLPSFIKRGTSYGDLHPDYSWFAYHYGSLDCGSYFINTFMYHSNRNYIQDYISLAPYNSDTWMICGSYIPCIGYDGSGVAKTNSGGIQFGGLIENDPSFGSLILNSQFDVRVYDKPTKYGDAQLVATCTAGVWDGAAFPDNSYLDGTLSGVLSGGVASGDITLDQLKPNIGVWVPTADQLVNGYTHADVITGTGALEGSGESGGDKPDDTGSILNKILAALAALSGLSVVPSILTGWDTFVDTLAGWLDGLWGWINSLNLAKWLADVWAWLSSIDLINLLSPLSAIWSWLGSLGLADWLAKVWDWIITLDLAGALQGIFDAVLNFPRFTWDGITGILSSLFIPSADHFSSVLDGLKNQLLNKFGIDFDFTSLSAAERDISKQSATFTFAGMSFTSAVFDPWALLDAVAEFRPYIRGFVVLMLLLYVINQVFKLLGSAGIVGGMVNTSDDGGAKK